MSYTISWFVVMGVRTVDFAGKSFNRGFNLRRHESEYCPLQDHNSSIESGSDQSTGNEHKKKIRRHG